jgi:hypothetical protein
MLEQEELCANAQLYAKSCGINESGQWAPIFSGFGLLIGWKSKLHKSRSFSHLSVLIWQLSKSLST